MDSFARVIHAGFVAVVLLVFCAVAWACPDEVTQYRWSMDLGNGTIYGGWQSSAAAACSDSSSARNRSESSGPQTTTWAGTSALSGGTCLWTGTMTVCNSNSTPACGPPSESIQGTTISSQVITQECDQCAAQAGKQAFGGKGEAAYSGGSGASPTFASAVCVGGCRYSISADAPQAAEKADSGAWTSRASAIDTKGAGVSCNAEPAATVPPCPKGSAPGSVTINGTTTNLCAKVDQSETKEAPKVTSVDTAASSPEVTTITKSTKCEGDRCTTTTTTTVSGGGGPGGTKTDTTGEGKSDYCGKNPKSKLCSATGDGEDPTSSDFGGACEAGFTCDGDAIQCAIAKDQHLRHCALFDTTTEESDEGMGFIGTAAQRAASSPEGHPANTPIEVNIGQRFSAAMLTNPLGSTCPGDQTIGPISIPLGSACSSFQLLGTIAVALTVLGCAGWLVTRGV